MRGSDFNIFFNTKKAILELVDRKWVQKSTLLANFTPVFGPFWGSKKSFSGLFGSCFGVVWEVFRKCFWTQKAYFWLYFKLKRLINHRES